MTNRTGIHGAVAKAVGRFLPWFGIGLLGIAIAFASRRPTLPPLEKLDPLFMKAVKASIARRDVQAVLAHQRSSAAVHLQLFSSCAVDRHCTVFTSMAFPGSEVQAPSISLHVAVHVIPGAGNARPTIMSSWEVKTIEPLPERRVSYAGEFDDMSRVPNIGEHNAIASLLTSIRSAVVNVLVADGVIAGANLTGMSTMQSDTPPTKAERNEN